MGREWAGRRIGTPHTGSRTEARFPRWRSRSISSAKSKLRPDIQAGIKKFGALLHPTGTRSCVKSLLRSGTDFWGVREYHPGDPLRHVDWRLAARHPQALFTREFEQEDTADIGLVLDARERIDVCVGKDSLFEHMVGATASLAEAFLHDGHRVSLLVYGEPVMTVFPGYSKGQLSRIMRALTKVQLSPDNSHLGLQFLPLSMFSSRALIVVISPLTLGDRSIFSRLQARGNEILLLCPDPIRFAHSQLTDDLAGRLGERAVRVERRLELRRIAQSHVRVIDWPVDQPLSPLLRAALRNGHGRRM